MESAEDLYENAPCGYLSTTPDGRIVRVNATFLRWTGYGRDELVGVKRFQDLLTAGGKIYHETHYAPLLRMQGSVREIAVDIVTAGGGRLPALVNSTLRLDDRGEPQAIRTTIFDATERKSYERELLAVRNRERAARERTERLQRLTAALVAAPDDDRAIVDAATAELLAGLGAVRVGEGRAPGGERTAWAPFGDGEDGLWVEFAEPRELDADEQALLTAAVRQTGLALERARSHARMRDVARTLQQSFLGPPAPRDPRFEISALYAPAVAHLDVGGDWHDSFGLPDGNTGIVVGDVVGRGLLAAAAMGQLRSAVRALALTGLGPEAVIRHLDTFVEHVEAAQFATLAYAEVDPDSGTVLFGTAGHPPPILFGPGAQPRAFMGGRSTPLGVPSPSLPRTQATFALPPGGGFVLYTDGLVERRGESIDSGIERLLAAVAADVCPSKLAEALIAGRDAADDVCVLVFSRTPR